MTDPEQPVSWPMTVLAPTAMALAVGCVCYWIGWRAESSVDGGEYSFLLAAFLLARRWPDRILSTALILLAVPILASLFTMWASGELAKPSRSTGGMVAVSLMAVFVLPWSWVLWFVGWLGACTHQRRFTPPARASVEAVALGLVCCLVSVSVYLLVGSELVAYLGTTAIAAFLLGRRLPGSVLRIGWLLWVVPHHVFWIVPRDPFAGGASFEASAWPWSMPVLGHGAVYTIPWLLVLWLLGAASSIRAEIPTRKAMP